MTATLLAFLAFFALSLAFRLPVGLSLGLVGFGGLWIMRGSSAAVFSGATEIFEATGYALSVVPMFVLMGNFVTRGGLSRQLYRAAYAFLGHRRGGLATSTIAACAGFGAVCGSAVATVATMAKVAVPEMRRFGSSDSLAAATVGAGGTLGILDPPVATDDPVRPDDGDLDRGTVAAGMVPGLVAMGFYMAASAWTVWRDPSAGPPGECTSWPQRGRALVQVWPVLLLFGLVIGGMYGGVFTATEAAGIGAAGGLAIAWMRGTLDWSELRTILADSVLTTGMLFTILIGAMIFANFVAFTTMTNDLMAMVRALDGDLAVAVAYSWPDPLNPRGKNEMDHPDRRRVLQRLVAAPLPSSALRRWWRAPTISRSGACRSPAGRRSARPLRRSVEPLRRRPALHNGMVTPL